MEPETVKIEQLKKGDSLTVKIERFTKKYLGEATQQGKTILVPGAIPGETIRGEVLRNWKRRLLLKPTEILVADENRVEPECKHFGICAGCQFQHIAYEQQLEIKRSRLEEYFQDTSITPLPLRSIIPSPNPYGYRNSITVHGPGEPGFWQVKGIEMLRNEECPICVPQVEENLQKQRSEGFIEFTEQGINNVIIRATKVGEVYVGAEQPEEEISWLTEELENPLTGKRNQFVVPAHAFWQGSTPMIPRLVEEVVRPIQAAQPEMLIESYCGVGLFGLMSAPVAHTVMGVEGNSLAVEAARRNQQNLGLQNFQIIEGNTEQHLEKLLEQAPREGSSLIVDPPRSGLPKKVLKQILRHPPQQLVYVSCNPESLARNLSQLCHETFSLQEMVGLDLFPQTKHLECVAVLERIPTNS
ncbi:MAG: class I SAM-dependent RNA methyltransferase [Cyanobacteria bacterium SW_6_48_11]|jgi:tRNA/tmRNA/rRNA uracil-C5-methylase (TrmA/RlmC/RlmD family)|nr:MAG: class I SAM-dependent RNA methyltransferase [Cyanobacteria bacterium QS_3_48_167]PSO98283.1 MAG: class I SAM-dependent RNA methyltransferase [Cyanobacteria bacterium SW_6_48_11]PSP07024.1 MAG: class I SAM-dependent RNA methyltransferase [Cyanobacteria bacterium SW_12_48_29]PSP13412.1 MAG: class I SAM-dependent RNA methyltransferase [Cyanobacteria bacterium SW_10_48_33]